MNEKLIGVVGSGTMGGGIALAAAAGGFAVRLFDVSEPILLSCIRRLGKELETAVRKGKLASEEMGTIIRRIHPVTEFPRLKEAFAVIEAVPEKAELKAKVFRELEQLCAPDALLATNTSSLSVTGIAAPLARRERVVGMHFFNPAHRMELVEVVKGQFTSGETVARAVALAEALGKRPVVVKDTPAFIVNRVARPFYGEALRILDEQAAPVEAVDRIVRGHGFRMGPFELMDLIGIDVNFDVTCAVYEMFFGEPRFRPHPIQKRMVEANLLGRKTGRGFYDYGGKG